ncbi:MAG TPA: LptF/LptG family permease, partial [Flavobacteriales bacterium]|nr:LptF/LptG family permease [Flavobacteriales bacterium]
VDAKNIHREITPGTIAYMESYNVGQKTGYRFSLSNWENAELTRKLTADRATYDSVQGVWHVYDYVLRDMTTHPEVLIRGTELDTMISLKPSDLGQRWETAMAMGWSELNNYIDAKKAQGDGSTVSYQIEKHQRTAYPFATYVFTLIGVSIASRKVRGGTGLHLALGVGLILIYVFSMRLMAVAATNAGMDPLIAVWTPNIFFAIIGVWIYRGAPK